MECPVCQKEFDEKTGRRPKKFCSDACKVRYWNSQKPFIAKKMVKKTPPTNSNNLNRPFNTTPYTSESSLSTEQIKEQIDALRKEIIHVPDNYSETGRIIWVKEREKKIKELKLRL